MHDDCALQVAEPAALLDKHGVAKILSVSVRSVHALKQSGALRHVRIGGMVRYRPEDVQEFIAANLRGGGQ